MKNFRWIISYFVMFWGSLVATLSAAPQAETFDVFSAKVRDKEVLQQSFFAPEEALGVVLKVSRRSSSGTLKVTVNGQEFVSAFEKKKQVFKVNISSLINRGTVPNQILASTIGGTGSFVVQVQQTSGMGPTLPGTAAINPGSKNQPKPHALFKISILAGNNQTGQVNTTLADPLRVLVQSTITNQPVANTPVTFKPLGSGQFGSGMRTTTVLTNASGEATIANFTLGINAGIEQVAAIPAAANVPGDNIQVLFEFTVTPAQATFLYGTSGRNQKGIVGQPLMTPFRFCVVDEFGNPLSGQDIDVKVTKGGGNLGQPDLTETIVTTNSEGFADVTLTLGPEPGLMSNEVQGNLVTSVNDGPILGSGVSFTADADLAGDLTRTTFTIQVLDDNLLPLEGVVADSLIDGSTAVSGPDGFLTLRDLTPGIQKIHLDASGITNSTKAYPDLTYEKIDVVAGNDNTYFTPFYLIALDTVNVTPVDSEQDTMVQTPLLPGFELMVPAGTAVFPPGIDQEISITRVPTTRLPMPLPDGTFSRNLITVQPHGLKFTEPVPVTFPNLDGLEPGEKTTIYSFDHDVGAYVSRGTATVAEDGLTVVSDPGSGFVEAGWHATAPFLDCANTMATTQVTNSSGQPVAGAIVQVGLNTGMTDLAGMVSMQVPSCESVPQAEVLATLDDQPEDMDDSEQNPDEGADPIFLHSGEFVYSLKYLFIQGRGLNYEFALRYESGTLFDGTVGHGWMHNFDKCLFQAENGDIMRMDGDGRVDTYTRNVAVPNGFISPPGFYDQLFKDDVTGNFVIRDRDGTRTIYSGVTGRLAEIRDRNGNQLQFRYDTQNRLTGVIDTYGREIFYDYNDEGRLVKVTDYFDRSVTLRYDDNDDLVSVTGPAVTGTSIGNDFPNGKAHVFVYSTDDNKENEEFRQHNITEVFRPNEVGFDVDGVPVAQGEAYIINTYNDIDQVISQLWGGTNDSGIFAGGVLGLKYTTLLESVEPGDFNTAVSMTEIIERNQNIEERFYNVAGNLVRRVEKTRGIRPDDPAEFVTIMEYNEDGERTRIVYPEGNSIEFVYDEGKINRFAEGNLLEITRVPDLARGGDQERITTKFRYEPIYNQLSRIIEPRGNDPDFVPQNGGLTSEDRYKTEHVFDYQEGDNLTALAEELGFSEAVVTTLLGNAGLALNLTDQNGDAITDQIAGNIIKKKFPTVALLADSQQALVEGDTSQEIEMTMRYNDRGQVTQAVDPEGNITTYEYHPENDPDGDAVLVPDVLSLEPRGYLKQKIADTAGVAIKMNYLYDPVGNLIEIIDGRGIKTAFEVNELNQVVQRTRAASVADVPGRAGGANGEVEDLTGQDFSYLTQVFYDSNDNVVERRIENRDGNTIETGAAAGFIEYVYTYDILDDLLSQTEEIDDTTTRTWTYRYDFNQNNTLMIMPEGNRFTYGYDERDLIAFVTRGDDDENAFDLPQTDDPQSIASRSAYSYDLNRNLRRVTDAQDNNSDGLGDDTLAFYDGFDRVKEVRDAVGNQVVYSYDPADNVVQIERRGLNGGASPINNNVSANVLLAQTQRKYDEISRLFQTDQFLFTTPGVTYNHPPVLQDGTLTPNDSFVTTRFEYDKNARMTFITEDDGDLYVNAYDGVNRKISMTDGENNQVSYEYDDNSNLVRMIETEKSPEGLVSDETFGMVNRYDSLNRLIRTTDTIGQTQRYGYDSRDNLIAMSDAQAPLGAQTETVLQSVTLNEPGNTCRYFYDGIDRLIVAECDLRLNGQGDQLLDVNQGGGDGIVRIKQSWDLNSRLRTREDDETNVTTYNYDALNRLTQEDYADTTFRQYIYDLDDNLVSLTDQNKSVRTCNYDGIDRMTQCSVIPAAGVIGTTLQTFQYDGLSRNTLCTDNNDPNNANDDSTVERKYDTLSRLLEEVQNGRTIASDWAADAQRVGLIYPNGREVNFTYDGLDRVKVMSNNDDSITNGLVSALPAGAIATMNYIGPNRLLEANFGNNIRKTYLDDAGAVDIGYDAIKRTVNLRHLDSNNNLIAGFEYGYNRQNHRLFEKRPHAPSAKGGDQVEYDSMYRVLSFQRDLLDTDVGDTAATSEQDRRDYDLDGVGNWETFTITPAGGPAQVNTQTINEMNEYSVFGSATRFHDDNGNVTDDGVNFYSYDPWNRLVEIKRQSDDAVIARYAYDCLSRRIEREVTNSPDLDETVLYFYDGYQIIEEQQDIASTLTTTKQYTYDPFGGLCTFESNTDSLNNSTSDLLLEDTFFYHHDAKMWVTAMTDTSGAVVERYTYDVYGRVRFEDAASAPLAEQRFSSIGNPHIDSGLRLDPESGFHYTIYRYKDPATGRFIHREPFGDGIWFDPNNLGSAYSWVGNMPWTYYDPYGQNALAFSGGVAIGFGEGVVDVGVGLGNLANSFYNDPVGTSGQIVDGVNQLVDLVSDKGFDKDVLRAVAPELYDIVYKADKFSSYDLGKKYGKVGLDLGLTAFGVGGALKAGKLISKLSKAQKIKSLDKGTKFSPKNINSGGNKTKTSSKYEDITKPGSVKNKKTDVPRSEFEKNLKKSGFEEKSTSNPDVKVFEKDGSSYTTRSSSKQGDPTADFRKDSTSKKPDLKIRLGGQ